MIVWLDLFYIVIRSMNRICKTFVRGVSFGYPIWGIARHFQLFRITLYISIQNLNKIFISIVWLIDGFTSRSRIFHLYGDVTITGVGLQKLDLCSALRAFEQGGIFIVPHLLWHGASFGLIRKTVPFCHLLRHVRDVKNLFLPGSPFSRLLRHTRGCGGSILHSQMCQTWISREIVKFTWKNSREFYVKRASNVNSHDSFSREFHMKFMWSY
jgi:hypothetical protein